MRFKSCRKILADSSSNVTGNFLPAGRDSPTPCASFHHEQSPHHRSRRSRQRRRPQMRHGPRSLRGNHPRLAHPLEVRRHRRRSEKTHRPHHRHRQGGRRQRRGNRRAHPQDRCQAAHQRRPALSGPQPDGRLPARRLRLHGHGELRADGCREVRVFLAVGLSGKIRKSRPLRACSAPASTPA